MVRRKAINASVKSLKLTTSFELCNQPNGRLDITDLVILDYIHRLPLYCRPNDDEMAYIYYCDDGKFVYSELDYPEFCETYSCINDMTFTDKEFYNRVDNLVNLGLVRTYTDSPELFIGYRTTGLYDEFLN